LSEKRERGILRMVTRYVVPFSLLAMALTSGLLIALGFQSHIDAIAGSLEISARYAADRTERFIGGKIEFLEAIPWIEGGSLGADLAERSLLDGALGFSPAFLRIAAIDGRGVIHAQASRRSAASARTAAIPFADEAAREALPGKPFLSKVHIDPVTFEPLITLGVAYLERFGVPDITLVAELNLKFMWDLIGGLDVEEGGRAYVVDSGGDLVAYGDPSRVLARENLARIPAVSAFMERGTDRRNGKLISFRGIEGGRVTGTYIPLESPPWAVVIELPLAVAYREARRLIIFGLCLVAGMSAAIALTGALLSMRLSAPILSLAGAVERIAETGELIGVEASGPREIAGLARSFNAMAERLKRNEARFKRLIWNSNDIIAVSDAGGVLSYVSASIERIFGYPPVEAAGKTLASFLHEEDREKADRAFAHLSRGAGALERAEFRMRARDGRWAYVEMIGVNLADDPDIGGMVLNLRDISDRREAERERIALQERLQHATKMEAVGRLAGGIAHDFNNILTGIYGSVQLAQMDSADSGKVEYHLGEIKKAAESAASLTRQLLAYSRKQPVQPKLVDLNALILEVGGMLDRLIGEDVSMEFELGGDLDPVRIDPGQLQQVLVNLSANARDAMPGGGRISVRTEAVALDEEFCSSREGLAPGRYARLTVEDTGTGMDGEALRHLFEPFYTTKSMGKGTGLGLAMVYGTIRQSGGFVEASSEPGRGTAFMIHLPMEAGRAAGLEREASGQTPARGTETVLLVEDKPEVMGITAAILSKLGYSVIRAACGSEALAIAESDRGIDMIMTDMAMPGMNGLELAERVKARRPSMKILFTSGYADEFVRRGDAVRALGRLIVKPYAVEELAAKVRETLDGA
jgi:PAS domain S-box-containing protein